MRLIDADALMKDLGINDLNCKKCVYGKDAYRNDEYYFCSRGRDFADACVAIENAIQSDLTVGDVVNGILPKLFKRKRRISKRHGNSTEKS